MSDLHAELLKINTQFPITGQDNSAEGFRNNFSYIKNSLEYADTSITDLQLAQSKTISVLTHDVSTTSWTISINESEYQMININTNSDLTITFAGTVDETYCLVRLQINNNSQAPRFINFFNENTGGKIISPVDSSIELPINQTTIVECWSVDNGTTIFVKSLGIFTEW
jgi:hypothetical protein